MKKYLCLMAWAVALTGRFVSPANADANGALVTTTNGSLFGYHVYGSDQVSRGMSFDGNNTSTPLWSLGADRKDGSPLNNFYLYNHNSSLAVQLFTMRYDTGQLTLGPVTPSSSNPPNVGQVDIVGGTSTAPRHALGVGIYGNQDHIQLYQNSAGTKRTRINLANIFNIGTDTGPSGLSNFYIKSVDPAKNPANQYPIIIDTSDVVNINNGLKHSGYLGFYGATVMAKPTITGCRSDGTALANLLTALKNLGLIDDQTTP
jgi:hypothetical protein